MHTIPPQLPFQLPFARLLTPRPPCPTLQVRQRDLDSGKVSLTELDYDRVRVPSSREGAEGGAAGSNGHGGIGPELAAEVASLLGSSDSIDSIDQWGWAERLKGMSREEVKEVGGCWGARGSRLEAQGLCACALVSLMQGGGWHHCWARASPYAEGCVSSRCAPPLAHAT
jgi:hypothetical protein